MFLGKYDVEILKQTLCASVICDIMDGLGFMDYQIDPLIRPLDADNAFLVGEAYTIHFRETVIRPEPGVAEQGNVDLSIEKVGLHQVVCMACQGSSQGAVLGEMMSTACKNRGVSGVVVDGAVRDTYSIKRLGLPVFSRYVVPASGFAKMYHDTVQEPVRFGGNIIHPGDIIMGDHDGIVLIPRTMATEVLDRALDRFEKEKETRDLLQQGIDIRTVFEKTGIM